MGRVRNRNKEADVDLARLRTEYNADKGGYTITTPASGRRQEKTDFYKSSYTPEQGGYYADKSIKGAGSSKGNPNNYRFYNEERASYISGNATSSGISKRADGGAAGRDKATKDAAIARKVAATPRKQVNPTVSGKRRTARRERALRYGREGTILTGTLGGSNTDERKKRKTLLG